MVHDRKLDDSRACHARSGKARIRYSQFSAACAHAIRCRKAGCLGSECFRAQSARSCSLGNSRPRLGHRVSKAHSRIAGESHVQGHCGAGDRDRGRNLRPRQPGRVSTARPAQPACPSYKQYIPKGVPGIPKGELPDPPPIPKALPRLPKPAQQNAPKKVEGADASGAAPKASESDVKAGERPGPPAHPSVAVPSAPATCRASGRPWRFPASRLSRAGLRGYSAAFGGRVFHAPTPGRGSPRFSRSVLPA